MRNLLKVLSLQSNLSYKGSSFWVTRSQIFHISSASKSPKPSQSSVTHEKSSGKLKGSDSLSSIFNEITEILGFERLVSDKASPGIFLSTDEGGLSSGKEKRPTCTSDVCRNAGENVLPEKKKEKVPILGYTQMEKMGIDEVSKLVEEIARIVRDGNSLVSMEERLEKLSYQFEADIVEKVLKRCFKVPHLALRFFNWVKLKEGFCHTVETYNVMLCMAGEAKQFGLMEWLMEEMEKNLLEKDAKTWTIVISQYGKAKLISKALLMFEKMRKSGCEPDTATYKTMVSCLCMTGKADIAMEFFKESVQKNMVLDLSLYKKLMKCMAISGDVAAVRSIADDMIKIYLIPEDITSDLVLRSFCISGRMKEALELIRELRIKDLTLQPEHFETLLRGLCRADRISDALEVLDIMKQRHLVDGKVYGIIINGYLRRNDIYKAHDLFQSMKESGHLPMLSTYTELIQHLFSLNDFEEGCKLYDEMLGRGVMPDTVLITAMVAAFMSQNRVPEAWEVFQNMKDRGIKPTWKSYSVFIKVLCKISKTDEIIKVLDHMLASEVFIRDEIFRRVITYMQKKGEVDAIEKVKQIQRVCKLDPQPFQKYNPLVPIIRSGVNTELKPNKSEPMRMDSHLVQPIPKGYSEQDLQEICKILSSSEDWSLIQETLEKQTFQITPELVIEVLHSFYMHGKAALHFFSWVGKQNNYRHTAESYNMAIKTAGSGKDFKHMRNLFYEMRRNGFNITSDTWTIMIMIYGRTGLTEMALNVLLEMKANGYNPTQSTYKYLIIAFCGKKGRKVDEAIKMYREMIRAGHTPDRELVETYLGCLCEVDKMLEARRCFHSLHKVGYSTPLDYSLFARALCRAGKLDEALALIEEVGSSKPAFDHLTSGALVHALIQRGRLEEALAKVDSMQQVGIVPSIHVYTSLIVHFFKEKQIERALKVWEEMQSEGCEPTVVTYSALIRGFMNVGRVSDAWNIFYRMKLKGPLPDFRTYSMFITCLCRVDRSEEALHLINEMIGNGIVPSTINFRTVFFGLNREETPYPVSIISAWIEE